MMTARELAQAALLVLKQIDKLGPFERDDVLHVARAIVQTEIARLNRPPHVPIVRPDGPDLRPVRDE